MFKNRVKFVTGLIIIFLFVLIGRLYNISVSHNREYTSRIQRQMTGQAEFYFPRGKFLDRNGIPLTGRTYMGENLSLPVNIDKNILAKHIIGDLQYEYKDNTAEGVKGVSGLQKLFDKELNGGLPIKIIQYKDGWGSPISEGKYYVQGDHENQGKNIKLTIDYHIQSIIEEEINTFMSEKRKDIEGESYYPGISIVLMDAQKGEVLGIASQGDQNNKSIHSYPLGSIFKTLVAIKAIEEGLVEMDEQFTCNGSILIDSQIKHCHKSDGHGEITFKDGFASSCNHVFYQVAKRLTEYNPNGTIKGNRVLELAREFGFSEYSKKKQDDFILTSKYSTNTIPDSVTCNLDVFNMALGQGVIEASPLMITKLMATIANDGVMKEPLLVKEIRSQDGDLIKEFNNKEERRLFDQETNRQVQSLLEEVTATGTARSRNNEDNSFIGGKTSTAQNGRQYPHSWFAGYFPTHQPKYAMTVFVEEGDSGSGVAYPLFYKISKKILDLGERN